MDYIDRNHTAVLDFMNRCQSKFDNFFFPLKQTHEFDLIALEKGICHRVRVICTESKQPSGNWIANLLVSGGYNDRKEIKRHFDNLNCDYVYIWTPIDKYLIPSECVGQKKAITLSNEYKSFILE